MKNKNQDFRRILEFLKWWSNEINLKSRFLINYSKISLLGGVLELKTFENLNFKKKSQFWLQNYFQNHQIEKFTRFRGWHRRMDRLLSVLIIFFAHFPLRASWLFCIYCVLCLRWVTKVTMGMFDNKNYFYILILMFLKMACKLS